MSEKVRSMFSARWISRALKIACVSSFVGLAACVASVGSEEPSNEEVAERLRAAGIDLCAGKAANTFQCIDDTRFQHCAGPGFTTIFVNSCPAGLCATRTPDSGNPCIGRDRAREIDGVEPPPPGAPGIVNEPPPPPPPPPPPADEDEEEEEEVAPPPPPPPPPVNNNGQLSPTINTSTTPSASNPNPVLNGQNLAEDGFPFDQGDQPPRDGSLNLRNQFAQFNTANANQGPDKVGLGNGTQFITGMCFSNGDCAIGACCARVPRVAGDFSQGFQGFCSARLVQFDQAKKGCGFDIRFGR
jgi:hypothetical protein